MQTIKHRGNPENTTCKEVTGISTRKSIYVLKSNRNFYKQHIIPWPQEKKARDIDKKNHIRKADIKEKLIFGKQMSNIRIDLLLNLFQNWISIKVGYLLCINLIQK